MIMDAVTGSAPKLLVDPKSALFTGSRKISGVFNVGIGPVIVGSTKLTGALWFAALNFSASRRSRLD
jgi:hypothetical protein